jgi:hypothetical protein
MLRSLKSCREGLKRSLDHHLKDKSKIWSKPPEDPERKNYTDSDIWYLIRLNNRAGCGNAHSQTEKEARAAFASRNHKIVICAHGHLPYEIGKSPSIRSECYLVVEKSPECKSVQTKPSAETASRASLEGTLVYQIGNGKPTLRDERRDGRIYEAHLRAPDR